MDLSSLDTASAAAAGATLHLRHPATDAPLTTDEGEPITIACLGMDSQAFVKRQNQVINQRLAAGTKAKVTAEAVLAESVDTIAACITGWQNVILDGAPLAFSPENAKKLLTRFAWIREQVDRFIGDRANFLPASPTS